MVPSLAAACQPSRISSGTIQGATGERSTSRRTAAGRRRLRVGRSAACGRFGWSRSCLRTPLQTIVAHRDRPRDEAEAVEAVGDALLLVDDGGGDGPDRRIRCGRPRARQASRLDAGGLRQRAAPPPAGSPRPSARSARAPRSRRRPPADVRWVKSRLARKKEFWVMIPRASERTRTPGRASRRRRRRDPRSSRRRARRARRRRAASAGGSGTGRDLVPAEPAFSSAATVRLWALEPRAKPTRLPRRSASLWMDEPGGTRMALPDPAASWAAT